MKKYIWTLIVSVPLFVLGAEYKDNPDHVPSFGLNFSGTDQTGTYESTYQNLSLSRTADFQGTNFSVDYRCPLSNEFTLNLSLGMMNGKLKVDETQFGNLDFFGGELETGGIAYNIGFRWYVH